MGQDLVGDGGRELPGLAELGQEVGRAVAQELGDLAGGLVAAGGPEHGDLGDGVLLRFFEAMPALEAALDLVETVEPQGSVAAHAGVHTGPVVERDLDVFGGTVNLTSRIAAAAAGGEVLTSLAVKEGVQDSSFRFEHVDARPLKGISEPVPLFRVTQHGS